MASGFSLLSDMYDVFIIDQWGVLHDGKKPYPSSLECLENLKKCGKILIMLSNSSKEKKNSASGLTKVGIRPDLFDGIVTSGQLGHDILSTSNLPSFSSTFYGDSMAYSKVLVFGNGEDDKKYVNSANLQFAGSQTADFILARGTFSVVDDHHDVKYESADDLMQNVDTWLLECVDRDLPMLVTNPDFHRPGSGSPMPGLIGRRYEALGGRVEYVGKPYRSVYEVCFSIAAAQLGKELDMSRVCGVGDSLEHDIEGANRMGIASVWTANGVHCKEMGILVEGSNELAAPEVLEATLNKYGATPTHTIASFHW